MVNLAADQAHYIKTVMRGREGQNIRLFNGRDGEWLCTLEGLTKKQAEVRPFNCIKEQPSVQGRIHLYFAPIKKQRMTFLIEKAVELGATDFHPTITQNTEVRKINEERMNAQIIEAAEQCERLTIPALHPVQSLGAVLQKSEYPILAAVERAEARCMKDVTIPGVVGFLVGPEGGFTAEEKNQMAAVDTVIPVSLGENILRSETAVLKMLSFTDL